MARDRHSPYTSGCTFYSNITGYRPGTSVGPSSQHFLESITEKNIRIAGFNRSKPKRDGSSSSRSKSLWRSKLRRNGPSSCLFRRSPFHPHYHIPDVQLPLLASTSKSPVLHHLSSVAATIPAPCRAIYSATKAAAFMAVESCRVECEGSGVRFFCEPLRLRRTFADRSSTTWYDRQWVPIKTCRQSRRIRREGRNNSSNPTQLGKTPLETRRRSVIPSLTAND
jgi:hypothetical protein